MDQKVEPSLFRSHGDYFIGPNCQTIHQNMHPRHSFKAFKKYIEPIHAFILSNRILDIESWISKLGYRILDVVRKIANHTNLTCPEGRKNAQWARQNGQWAGKNGQWAG
jgi:hypothetical protein